MKVHWEKGRFCVFLLRIANSASRFSLRSVQRYSSVCAPFQWKIIKLLLQSVTGSLVIPFGIRRVEVAQQKIISVAFSPSTFSASANLGANNTTPITPFLPLLHFFDNLGIGDLFISLTFEWPKERCRVSYRGSGVHTCRLLDGLCTAVNLHAVMRRSSYCPGSLLPELPINGPLCLPQVSHSRLKRGNWVPGLTGNVQRATYLCTAYPNLKQ